MEPEPPRWDRNRVLFETLYNGQLVECAISREALQDLSERRYAKPAELMECFARIQPRIESVAQAKLAARPDAVDGLLIIWSSDLEEAEPDDETRPA